MSQEPPKSTLLLRNLRRMTEKVTALPPNMLKRTRVANNTLPVVVDRDTNEGCCCPSLLLFVLMLVEDDDDDAPEASPSVGVVV